MFGLLDDKSSDNDDAGEVDSDDEGDASLELPAMAGVNVECADDLWHVWRWIPNRPSLATSSGHP